MAKFTFNAWADPHAPQFNPFVWATGAHEVAQYVATNVAGQMLHKPPDQRALMLAPALEEIASTDKVDLIATGRNVAHHVQWFTAFFRQLARRRCRPSFIALDEEWSFTTFDIFDGLTTDDQRIAAMQRYYDNAAVRAKMPANVAALTPESFVATGWSNPTTSPSHLAWNRWAEQYTDRLIRKMVYEPARRAWPGITTFGNYNFSKLAFTVPDFNGWPIHSVNVTGTGSPATYLLTGPFYKNNRTKDQYWNTLISMLNSVRASVASGSNVVPWASHASYDGSETPNPRLQWAWKMLIEHSAACGINEFVYWNPVTQATDDDNALAADVIDEMRAAPPAPATPEQLAPIPLDADEFTTGNMTVTYDDFVNNVLA